MRFQAPCPASLPLISAFCSRLPEKARRRGAVAPRPDAARHARCRAYARGSPGWRPASRRMLGKSGGLARNRTGVQGFAVLCVTTPPRGLPRDAAISEIPKAAYNHMPASAATANRADREPATQSPAAGRKRVAQPRSRRYTPPPIPDSSAVEQSTVNRLVAGSNPAPGASHSRAQVGNHLGLFLCRYAIGTFRACRATDSAASRVGRIARPSSAADA